MHAIKSLLLVLILLLQKLGNRVEGFGGIPGSFGRPFPPATSLPLFEASPETFDSTILDDGIPIEATDDVSQEQQPSGPIRAPLKFLGPYIGLGLNFPDLATTSQRSRNISGIALDFVLDTAANINTLNQQVAQELKLEIVAEAPAGVSASGPMSGGATYFLGSCQLEGLPEEEQFSFMENLTASALPVASPAAAGLLSMSFFQCFEGGVEFDWYGRDADNENDGERLPPSITFYGSLEESACSRKDMSSVPITELPVTHLPTVNLIVNGVHIPCLFDTGSPITVLNSQAAEQAGVKTVKIGANQDTVKSSNPFTGLVNKFQEAQATAQAAARGDILTIAGATGERIDLIKSELPVDVALSSGNTFDDGVNFGKRHIYVGNIPGLAALNGLGDDSPPAAVLGMDLLRSKPKMLLLASDQKIYF
jgi:hypothetical protein